MLAEPSYCGLFYITSLLFPPTVNGEHHKGIYVTKQAQWFRARMGKKSRLESSVCQPPLTCISPVCRIAHVGVYIHPFTISFYPPIHPSASPICSPVCRLCHVSLTECWCFASFCRHTAAAGFRFFLFL